MQGTLPTGETVRIVFQHSRGLYQKQAGRGGITHAYLYRVDEDGRAEKEPLAQGFTIASLDVTFSFEIGRRKALKNMLYGDYQPHRKTNKGTPRFDREARRAVWQIYWDRYQQAGTPKAKELAAVGA